MSKKIFINLAVKDLEKSKDFYTKLGFTLNPQFTDQTAACMVISPDIFVMLLTHDKFKQFTTKEIANSTTSTEALLALTYESKEEVDQLIEKVIASGGSEARPVQDMGFMYSRAFQDPDGHIWEPFWMDPSVVQE